jgi:hypothetical protein
MSDTPNSSSTPVTIKKIATNLRQIGWLGLWVQLFLAAVSTVFAITSFLKASTGSGNTVAGGIFSFLGLLILYVSVYWFSRYSNAARKFKDPNTRPSKADTIAMIRMGIIISLTGCGIAIVGAESTAGTLMIKTWTQLFSLIGLSRDAFNKLVEPTDILIIMVNIHTIAAHFLGLLGSLWLLNGIVKQSQ